jgi:tetratricopeptide (TPR) repeat protein
MTPRLQSIGIAIILTTIVNTPMKIKSSTLTSADVYQVINEAREAELCRNIDLFRDVLSVVWEDLERDPDFETFELSIRSELLRLCGVFLSHFGRSRSLPDYQIRAKDILTRAAELFETGKYTDKAAETKVALANCYWFSGEVSEYEDLIKSVEDDFSADPRHPVAIQIKLNRLLIANWKLDQNEARYFIQEISKIISPDHNLRLRTQFHNLAGINFSINGHLDLASFHFNEAVHIAKDANYKMFVAVNLNNLAFVYRQDGHFRQAHETSDKAIAITEARGDKGWTAHFLDTKALIYLDQCEYSESLKVIEKSIEIFSKGEDYGGLTDAMWTKCICLLRLKRHTDALAVFIELGDIAARQIGQVGVDKFTTLLMEQIHILRQFPLTDELAALKRSLVVKAMRESGGHVAKAARKLGLRSQQHLSEILNNQFPDIYDELGIKRRAKRSNETKKEPPLGLSRLIMPKNRTYSFNFTWRGTLEPQFFYFPRNLMRPFGIKNNGIVAVMPVKSESLFDGGIVLYSYIGTFRIGRLAYDELAQIFLVDLEELIFLSDVHLIGVPIGYCPVSDRHKRTMKFEALEFIK